MGVSAELRWFWRDELPPRLEAWFREGAFPPGGGRTRNDEYLLERGQAELGVKKRGGGRGVEVKGLVGYGAAFAPPFAGRAQVWSKWTSQALTIDHLPRIVVRKTRWVRKYDTSSSEVREVEVGEDEQPRRPAKAPEHGCQLDLVSLGIKDENARWWSLGLEGFGPLDSVERNLARAVAHLARTAPPSLAGGRELSYAEWLKKVVSHE